MLIRKRKVVTVHNPRTALSSIEVMLCHPKKPLQVEKKAGFWNKHFDLDRVLNAWSKQIDKSWLLLGCVRCPLELIASQWLQVMMKLENRHKPKGLAEFREYVETLQVGGILYPISAEVDSHMPEFSKQTTSAGLSQVRFFTSATECPAELVVLPFEKLTAMARTHSGQRNDVPRYLLPYRYEHWYTPEQRKRVLEDLAPADFEFHQRQLRDCPKLDLVL
jgi:hypothetical protein